MSSAFWAFWGIEGSEDPADATTLFLTKLFIPVLRSRLGSLLLVLLNVLYFVTVMSFKRLEVNFLVDEPFLKDIVITLSTRQV